MSSNWRSLQHRHKYTYTSVIFPKSFTEALHLIPSETLDSFNFFSELKNFASLNSTYSQLSEVKKLASAFTNLLSTPQISEELIFTSTRFYLEILFLENSLPLHRTLISVLNKCRTFHHVISNCFATLCEEHSNLSKKEKKRFLVSRATLSLIGYPKLGVLDETIAKCSNIVALDVVSGLESILLEVSIGSRPSPVVMEQCQEAMSCMYYLLQKYPSQFTGSENSSIIFKSVLNTILTVLKSNSLSRDCLVASGVSFCAAIQALMNPTELSSFISSELFQFILNENSYNLLEHSDLVLQIETPSILSRLCLLRGILTAIPREVLNTRMNNSVNNKSTWTILYNGILPELCIYCENPTDSHFNFHALTVTQICLQQIKTSIFSNLTDFSENYSPFSEEIISRILRIIWKNLEDTLSQTVKQVHLIFDLLLDIKSSLPSNNEKIQKNKLFLSKIALDLLSLGPRCKGRYIPLASLTKRLGAKSLLNLNSNLIFETVYSYSEDDTCCAATSFLKILLETLRDECWAEFGIEKGYNKFRIFALNPLMQGLVSGQTKLRSNLNTYAISTVLDVDTDSIFSMLEFISIGADSELSKFSRTNLKLDQCITTLVSLLKVSRNTALIEGDIELESDNYAIILIKGMNLKIPVKWFLMALTHSDESVRIDVAETLFLNPKTSSLPSDFELGLMRKAVPLNMRCSSTAFQMKWTSLFRKFFSRVRTALERQAKQGAWVPKAEALYQFMNWLSTFLFSSCYPSAPYERKTMAMELILIMLEIWPMKENYENALQPYPKSITSPDSTISLVGSIVDSWDKLRENAFRILFAFPTPLPGISESDVIDDIIKWAKKLVRSPRVRESDAGALTMRLVFKKYVLGFGCLLEFSSENDCLRCCEILEGSGKGNPVIQYVSALIDWLQSMVEEGERDLAEACRKSFVHGILLTLRYTFEELDWGCELVQACSREMKGVLGRLLGLIVRISSIALWVVSSDAWYMPVDVDGDDGLDEDGFVEEESVPELEETGTKRGENGKPGEHFIMVGSWLAMKEVSLLFGTIIRKVPLPSGTSSEESGTEILDLGQLETMGNHFLQVLLKMKHNGAIDKTRAGFTALCNRLLCSNDSRLCKMTESWMEILMNRTVSKNQTVDDLLRRSAGIPAAFTAFFLAEPEGAPKKLLPKALNSLLEVTKIPFSSSFTPPNPQLTEQENISKMRDEGVVPTVHAFNAMRAAFNDANLAADTSGFSAEAIIVCIKSFKSSYWEVRNAATLAYTALVRRMVGFLNVQKRESSKRSLTGLEFFHRYPALHPFLLAELQTATESLSSNGSISTRHAESNIAKAIHPSICPILILLSRLKPSPINSDSNEETLDPFTLLPFIQKCVTQNNLKIRVLASRALTGLVSNEKLHRVVIEIAGTLPRIENSVQFNAVHGLLLQLHTLLDVNCRYLTEFSKKDEILRDLFGVLTNCSWLGSAEKCNCPIVSTLYLRVLDIILDISRTSGGTSRVGINIRYLIFELSSKCLDMKISKEIEVIHDPTRIELREQAAISYFNSFSKGNNHQIENKDLELNGLNERILSCVSDCTYEIRVSTMKRLVKIVSEFKGGEKSIFYSWAQTGLQTMLMDRLFVEENPKCVYYILKIIFSWHTQFNARFEGSIFSFWDRLVQLNGTTSRAKTKEIIVCCMSICMKNFVELLKSSLVTEELEVSSRNVDSFVDLVKGYSDPSQPVNMRKAACDAIIASSLLQESSFVSKNWVKFENSNLGKLVLNLWFVTIQLLEDEDASIRQKLANYLQNIISDNMDENNNDLCDDFVSTQVDRVIEMSFEFLSAQFGNTGHYLNHLARKVLDTAFYANSRGDLVRQIFDKEIDNHHEEKLLICQICCSNLEKLIKSNDNGRELQLFVQNWRGKFLNDLVHFMRNLDFKCDWIGGIGNHKDAFIAVYANLLGTFALSKYELIGGDVNGVCLDLKDLKEIIGPFIRNPLIYNLYILVIKERIACSDLNKFDPYFLIG